MIAQFALLFRSGQDSKECVFSRLQNLAEPARDFFLVRRQFHHGVRDQAAAPLWVGQGSLDHAIDEPTQGRESRAWLIEEGELLADESVAVSVDHFEEQLAFIAEGIVQRASIEVHCRE